MTKYIAAKEVAKLARQTLKDTFPGQKFSVRTENQSLNIMWIDGPSTKAVDDVVDRYAGEGFEGMSDMRYSRQNAEPDAAGEAVHYMTDFVFTHREINKTRMEQLRTLLAAQISMEHGIPVEDVLKDNRYWSAPQAIWEIVGSMKDGTLYGFVRILDEALADGATRKLRQTL